MLAHARANTNMLHAAALRRYRVNRLFDFSRRRLRVPGKLRAPPLSAAFATVVGLKRLSQLVLDADPVSGGGGERVDPPRRRDRPIIIRTRRRAFTPGTP